ncbi:MAG: hypothetical protein GF370_03105 [Candidatus Nealsonbacteria bacterium]|nr:hypothetical protein [Candidatus Nealsonbacteria bacterium]
MFRESFAPFLIIISIFFSIFFPRGLNIFQKNLEGFLYTQISVPGQNLALANVPPQREAPEFDARSVLSVRVYPRSGKEKIFIKKEADRPFPIASITKLMTALIVMEGTPSRDYQFSRAVPVSSLAANQDDVPVYGNLKEGEIFTVEKLLRIMLFYSSNDAAFALSEVIGTENFVQKMNQKAQEIGMEDTYFVNPTGLEPRNNNQPLNESSAEDILTLSKYIADNYPLIFRFSLEQGPYPRINGISDLYLPKGKTFIGGKTGYTDKAGGCMMTVVEDENGNQYVNVVLGTLSPYARIQEMQKLINWVTS